MDRQLLRVYLLELAGSFAFVTIAAGVVCVNHMALPAGQSAGVAPLTLHQPGAVGVALASGLTWAVLVALLGPVTGGWLNPAVTMALWLWGRLSTTRAAWLIGAQLLGGLLAGLCLRYMFADDILRSARFGATHLNLLAYPDLGPERLWPGLGAGVAIELGLTFLFVFAIFGGPLEGAGWRSGAVLAAATLFAFPLTGAALNPARWLGPTLWECFRETGRQPFADAFVYVAGPVLGAIVAGWCCFKLMPERPAGK